MYAHFTIGFSKAMVKLVSSYSPFVYMYVNVA